MNIPSLLFAFIAGLVSFLAPCVLPLMPGFLVYLAGSSLTNGVNPVVGGTNHRRDIFINSCFFVLGFSLVFAAAGVLLNTILAAVAYDVQRWLSRLGGIAIIFFGLYLTGLIKITFLEQDHHLTVKRRFSSRYITSLVFGAAFAIGWSPCVGAVLGAVLVLAATQPGAAFALLLSYALGLGVPFLIIGLFAGQAAALISRSGPWLRYINIVFGIVLVGLGVLVATQTLSLIGSFDFITPITSRL